jgi:hypothetical protein
LIALLICLIIKTSQDHAPIIEPPQTLLGIVFRAASAADSLYSTKRVQDLSSLCDPGALVGGNIVPLLNKANLMVFGVASNKKYSIVLHHFSDFGSSHLVPDACTVALFGISDVAILVAIDCETSFKAFAIRVPSWYDLFKARGSVKNFKPPTATGHVFTRTGMIMVPQALGVLFVKYASKDATDIGIVAASALAHREVISQTDPYMDSFMTCCRYDLLFCKAMSDGYLPSTVCSPSESPHVIEWSASLQAKFIKPRTLSLSGTGIGDPSYTTMQQVSATMLNMAIVMLTHHNFVVAQSEKMSTGLVELGSHTRKLIMFASSSDA